MTRHLIRQIRAATADPLSHHRRRHGRRYDPDVLADTLGRDLTLVETRRHAHTTPWGATQSFQYCRLQRAH